MGLPGIGLPEDSYMKVAKKLYGMNSKIICPSSYGGICHSDLYCVQLLPSIEDVTINMKFNEDNNI
jgi:hypothetical protein